MTAEDRGRPLFFVYNDIVSLQAAKEASVNDLAAVTVSALRHDMRQPQVLATPGFARAVRALRDENGAALTPDNPRAGMRINPSGF